MPGWRQYASGSYCVGSCATHSVCGDNHPSHTAGGAVGGGGGEGRGLAMHGGRETSTRGINCTNHSWLLIFSQDLNIIISARMEGWQWKSAPSQ